MLPEVSLLGTFLLQTGRVLFRGGGAESTQIQLLRTVGPGMCYTYIVIHVCMYIRTCHVCMYVTYTYMYVPFRMYDIVCTAYR